MAHRRRIAWPGDQLAVVLTVALGLTSFVVGTYLVVVEGGGRLLGAEGSRTSLSLAATVVVALAISRVQAWLLRVARYLVDGGRSSPYDVLRRLSQEATVGRYDARELPQRMAMLLTDATHAAWSEVWLTTGAQPTLAAVWPTEGGDPSCPPELPGDPGARSGDQRLWPISHGGELLGIFRLKEPAGRPLRPVEEHLVSDLAAHAGLVMRTVTLRSALADRRQELRARAAELTMSRQRLVKAQDDARRRLERDLHDGAQQQLVALAVNLRLAETVAARDPERARRIVAAQRDLVGAATTTVGELSRGLHPRRLADDGLAAAIQEAAAASPVPVTVTADGFGRCRAPVERALYFCALEALQNAAKHAAAHAISVRLEEDAGCWRLSVVDDGRGFPAAVGATRDTGRGLVNMADRLDSVGGSVAVVAQPGGGTRVTATVPKNEDHGSPNGSMSLVTTSGTSP